MEPMQAVLCFIANRSFPLNCSSDDLNNFINENEPSESEELFYYYLWTIVAPCLFCAITVIGTIGNLLVIYVILSQAALRNATNILLVSLALADVVFLLLSVPFTAYKYAVFTWPFGDVICMIVQYILYVTAYVTIYTLVAVSALRFMVVVCSRSTLKYQTQRNAVLLASGIWAAVLIGNVPTMLSVRVKSYGESHAYCGVTSGAFERVAGSFFVLGYAVPLTMICVLYCLIAFHLRSHRPVTTLQARWRHRNARTLRVILLVVLVFCVSWLPIQCEYLAMYLKLTMPDSAVYEALHTLWMCMAYGNSCANPFIYNLSSKEFRKNFRTVFRHCSSIRGKLDGQCQSLLNQSTVRYQHGTNRCLSNKNPCRQKPYRSSDTEERIIYCC